MRFALCLASLWIIAAAGFAPGVAFAEWTVESVAAKGVALAGPEKPAAGTVFEVKKGNDLLGFLLARDDPDQGVHIELIAGRAEPGAEVIPMERPTARVGFLGGAEDARVKGELAVLCPGRVVTLQQKRDLDPEDFDAVVITSAVSEQALQRFVQAGRLAIVDLAVYAAWSGAKPEAVASDKELRVEVVGATDATRGLAVGQTFAHYGRAQDRRVCRCLADVRDGGRVLLKLLLDGRPVAVEHEIGKGRLLAVDLVSPNGEPGHDAGAVLKWVLPGNLLAGSVRYVRALSERLGYDEYMKLQEELAERIAPQWVREKVGVDSGGKPIWRFRRGPLDGPILFFVGAIHAGEWLNPYLLLDFIEYLADVPEADYKTRWVLRNYTITVIPMLSGSMRQESAAGCDLNRNFDFRWEDYTKGYGWREGRALKLRGPAPFSEPEARVVRDHVWSDPVIGHFDMHMHGIQHGAMFLGPHEVAEPALATFDAAAHVIQANVRDRFLWKGPTQLELRRVVFSGRTVPYSTNWVAYQGVWSVSSELVGGADHSLQEKELGFEGMLAFLYAVGVDHAAGKRRWLGYPRTGFARPGGWKDATALVFTADGRETIAYRTNRGSGTLRLPLAGEGCRLYDEDGEPVQWTAGGNHCVLPMGPARYFFECGSATREQVLEALKQSKFEPSP
jgi:predicted deacylase